MQEKPYELNASLYFSAELGYSLYVLRNKDDKDSCVAAFHFKDACQFIKNLEIFLRRDSFGVLDEKIDRNSIEIYNSGWRDYEIIPNFIQGIPGGDFGAVIDDKIIIWPLVLPKSERALWVSILMKNSCITLPRIGFQI